MFEGRPLLTRLELFQLVDDFRQVRTAIRKLGECLVRKRSGQNVKASLRERCLLAALVEQGAKGGDRRLIHGSVHEPKQQGLEDFRPSGFTPILVIFELRETNVPDLIGEWCVRLDARHLRPAGPRGAQFGFHTCHATGPVFEKTRTQHMCTTRTKTESDAAKELFPGLATAKAR